MSTVENGAVHGNGLINGHVCLETWLKQCGRKLNEDQWQLIQLLRGGRPDKEISAELGITSHALYQREYQIFGRHSLNRRQFRQLLARPSETPEVPPPDRRSLDEIIVESESCDEDEEVVTKAITTLRKALPPSLTVTHALVAKDGKVDSCEIIIRRKKSA